MTRRPDLRVPGLDDRAARDLHPIAVYPFVIAEAGMHPQVFLPVRGAADIPEAPRGGPA